MRTKANSPGGGAKQASKLLAAMAILAVAFVVLAAVPAALTDSDAAMSAGTPVAATPVTEDITADAGASYYIGKLETVATIDLNGTADVTLYISSSAEVKLKNSNATQATTKIYVASGYSDEEVSFYDKSEITVTVAKADTAITLKMQDGGYYLATGIAFATAGQSQQTISVAYSDRTMVWTTEMAANTTMPAFTVAKTGTADKSSGVTVTVPTESDKNAFSFKVGVGSNQVTVTGPFTDTTGGSFTLATTDDKALKATIASIASLEGTITRDNGEVTIDGKMSGAMANGMLDTAGTKAIAIPTTSISLETYTSGITVLKDTKLLNELVVKDDKSQNPVFTLGSGLTTKSTLTLGWSSTTLTISNSAKPWTGNAIAVNSTATVVDLSGQNIGSLTVEKYTGKVEVKSDTSATIWGTLTVNDNDHTTHTQDCNTVALTSPVVTESGSIVLSEKVVLTATTDITALGSITGDGTIDSTGITIKTQDGKKSNITVSNAKDLNGTVSQAEYTMLTAKTSEIDLHAEEGYKIIKLGEDLPITETYTFPEGITVNAEDELITIIGSKTNSVTVTLPNSTTLVLGGENYKEADGTVSAIGGDDGIMIGTLGTTADKYSAFVVEGQLDGKGCVYGTGTFELASTGRVKNAEVTVVTMAASGDDVAQEFSGVSLSVPYPVYQKQIVPEGKTITIQSLSDVMLNGGLQVDGTLVIEKDASLTLGLQPVTVGDGQTTTYLPQGAAVTVSSTGSIVVKDGGLFDALNATVTSSGNIQMEGTMLMSNSSSLTLKSTMTESSTGVLGLEKSSKASITVASSGVLTLQGYLGYKDTVADVEYDTVKVLNSGSVVVDNASIEPRTIDAYGDLAVSLRASGANVVIDSYIAEKANSYITIDDSGLSLTKIGSTSYYATAEPGKSGEAVSDLSNEYKIGSATAGVKVTGKLTVASEVTSVADEETLCVEDRLLISGSVSNGTTAKTDGSKDAVKIAMTAKQPSESKNVDDDNSAYDSILFTSAVAVAADSTMVIGTYVDQTNAGLMDVDGYLDMTVDKVSGLTNSGEITVTGEVKIKDKDITGGKINAAKYVLKEAVGSSTATYNVYTTLDQAVVDILEETNTNTDKTITLYGKVYVTEDVVVNEPISVKFASSNYSTNQLIVGTSDDTEVVLAFEDGAKLTGERYQVDVYGTLYFADSTDDATKKTICDVKVESDDGDRMYTNIYTALASAESGDTVQVTREATDADGADQYVQLTRSVTVGDGVTLRVASSVAGLWLADGVTMTVNGTVYTDREIVAESRFGVTASTIEKKESSAIVVNGTMKGLKFLYGDSIETADGAKLTAGAPIAGAYYIIDGVNYLSTVEIAQKNFAKVAGAVTVNGPVVAGDLSFAKTSSSTGTSLVIGDLTATGATTSLTASSITIDEVSVIVKSTNGAYLTAVIKNDSASVTVSKIKGTALTFADKSGVLSLTGTATASKESVLDVTTGTVQAGTTATTGGKFNYTASDDQKAMTVASGATLTPKDMNIDKLTVNGTFEVPQGETATVGTLVDLGTVSVFAGSETASESTLTVDYLWIGTSADQIQKSTTGAAATFSGPAKITKMAVVLNGATVDSDAQEVLSDITKKTEFYVKNALWITVYIVDGDKTIGTFNNPVITNAYFAGWYNADGKDAKSENVGDTGFEKVYASINTKIYHVEIKADQGIGDLYLNGNIMFKGFKINNSSSTSDSEYYYAYWADVEAGDYEVTCKLANGYGGTAVLKNTDGTTVSNNKFTASGTPETSAGINLNFQLTGIAKTGYVQPAEEKDDDSGMGITDYLLIVLVILVVVLAVIVALRLMRS